MNPMYPLTFLKGIDTIRTMIWEEKLLPISVKALSEMIIRKGGEEYMRIHNLAFYKARQQLAKGLPNGLLDEELD